jgi:hypothetical protein
MVALITKFADILAVAAGSFLAITKYAAAKKTLTEGYVALQKKGFFYSQAENALAKALVFFKGSELTLETAMLSIKKRGFFTSLAEMALAAGQAVMKGLAGMGPLGLLAPIAGAAAIAGLYAIGKSYLKGDDVVSQGGMAGYGKRTLMAPEGSIALNDNDTVIAGTNLGGGSGNRETKQMHY